MTSHGLPARAAALLLAAAIVPVAAAAADAGLVAHVPTGPQPTTVTLLDGGTRIAVANRGDESVLIFDAETLEPVAQHSLVGRHGLWGVAQPGEGRLLVSHWKGETVSLMDAASGELGASFPVGIKPSYLALSPDGTKAYVAGQLTGDVSLLDLGKPEPERVLEVGQKPMGVAASADGRWLYVAACRSRKVAKVDLKYEVVLTNFGAPLAETTNLALTPDGRILLAAGDQDRLLLIDTETGRTDKVKVPASPAAVAVSPDGRTAFVACYRGASIAMVDLAGRQVVREMPVGPGCIDVATDGRRVYSVSDQAAAMSVWELGATEAADAAPAEIPAPVGPAEPAETPEGSPLARE